MNEVQRAILFWAVCIPTRVAATVVAESGVAELPMRLGAGVISYRWLSGAVSSTKGFFGGEAWWADERPLHGVLWGLYSTTGNWKWLMVDTAFGGVNYLTKGQ